jgi:heme exporter protein C
MKKHWWKILAVVLMLYVIVAGLLVPLGAGIVKVSPEALQKGQTLTLDISTYNTELSQAKGIYVWVEHKEQKICAGNIQVTSDNSLKADIQLPASFRGNYADLFINTQREGTFALENALTSIKDGDSTATAAVTSPSDCDGADRNAKASFFNFPNRTILYESIRNLFFHVAIWMALLAMVTVSLVYSIRYLAKNRIEDDIVASETANSAILLGLLGLATGSFWARFTWGAWWVSDPQLNGAAIAMLIYLAYLVLRSSLDEEQKRGRIAAVYNIFAYVMLLVFIGIYPKLNKVDSLHPGSGGNPRFSNYDMDNALRMFFYPAVIAFFLIGLWIANIRIRLRKIRRQVLFNT